MSQHHARIDWSRDGTPFTYETYPRAHTIAFGGGATLRASAAVEYRGDGALPNPEELLVAALSSCHMLTFLAIAARRGLTVDRYEDHAEGTLAKDAGGRLAVTTCVLRPRIGFGEGTHVEPAELARLHEQAHRGCFIASSVRTDVRVEPAAEAPR